MNLEKLDFVELTEQEKREIEGGMKWTNDRSCNVEDRRPGADPVWMQKVKCYLRKIVLPEVGDKWFD